MRTGPVVGVGTVSEFYEVKYKIWKKARIVESGVMVGTSGVECPFTTDFERRRAFVMPVKWQGNNALMRFYNWREDFGVNPVATRMLDHSHLVIHGPVWITTEITKRFKMRVWATRHAITGAIQHLDLSADPDVVEASQWIPQHDIYTATEQDQLLIKMAL